MELEIFSRQLKMLALLTENRSLSIEDISTRLNISKRTIYRYLDAYKSMGFIIHKEGTKYSLDHNSPFYRKLVDSIQFTEDEALTISQVLNSVYNNSIQVRHLREKLAKLYDTEVLAKHGVDNHLAQNISTIFRAIREEKIVILKNYHSPSSKKIGDREVEPYQFLNENSEVRCYEIKSGQNKTFKISRADSVELVDLLWSHKEEHKPFFSDLFHFNGENQIPVSIILGPLATALLLEEFPDSQRQLHLLPDGRHQLDTKVCSYLGIGRFVLGLYNDIEVVSPAGFIDYLKERLKSFIAKT